MDAVPALDQRRSGRTECYRFDDIVVDATAHTLERAGQALTVEPKVFAVLISLLRHADELVPRDVLLDEVWGHRHVTPGVLTRAIAQLRHALGDDVHRPRYIQTQHALGYRFIGQLQAEPVDTPGDECVPVATGTGAAVADGRKVADAAASGEGPAAPSWTGRTGETRALRSTGPYREDGRAGDVPRRRTFVAVAVALVVLLLVAAFVWRRLPQPAPAARASVAVLPFTSLGPSRDDGYFAEGLAIEMHDALAGVPGLQVVDARGARARDDPRTLGRRYGVASVLDASVQRDGPRVRIHAWLSDARTGVTLWSERYDRESTDVFATQAQIAGEVVEALLGALPGEQADIARRLAPTRSLEAYDAYLKGMQRLYAPGGDAELSAAVALFEQALAADPSFARAQAGICRAQIARFEDARDVPAFERAQQACGRASSMDPALREVTLAQGELHRVRGDHARAIAYYRQALDDVALRAEAWVGLARSNAALGRDAVARDYLVRALRLQPADASIHRERGYVEYLSGNLPAAIESYRTATRLAPDDERLWSSLGGLYLTAGDDVQAARAFERSLEVRPNYAALSNYGSLRYETGDYARAAALYRHAADLDPSDFRIWGNIGDALSALPETAGGARKAYARAAGLAQRYIDIRPDDAQALALLAWYRVNLDEERAARTLLARAERDGAEPGEVAFLGAQTLAVLGDADAARERLRKARDAGISGRRLHASPVLRPLLVRDAPVVASARAD